MKMARKLFYLHMLVRQERHEVKLCRSRDLLQWVSRKHEIGEIGIRQTFFIYKRSHIYKQPLSCPSFHR